MNKFPVPGVVAMALAILATATAVLASEAPGDARIQRVENGLLPRVALRENLGATASITERMEALGIPGISIAVIDAGRVAWARGYGLDDMVERAPVTAETVLQAGSISKPIAALGALRLVKEGKVSLDEDVNGKLRSWRVPENEQTREEKVTLRRLMSHTAGLTVPGFPGYPVGTPIPTVVQVLNGEPPANTLPVFVDVRPGSQYRYSGGGYTVMQLLIADVAGESFESFMQEKVLNVLGMRSSTYSQDPAPVIAQRRSSGHLPGGDRVPGKLYIYPEMAAAGLWTTPTDLAQYLIYAQGAVRGNAGDLLDASLAKELLTQQNGGHGLGPEIYAAGEFARFGHDGSDEGFEAAMVAYVEHGKGVVIMANANRAAMLFDEIKASVARAYDWPGFPSKPQIAAERISSTLLGRAPGTYQLTPDMTGVLSVRNDRLFLNTARFGRIELFAKSATELFALPLGPNSFELVETDGKVTALKESNGQLFKRVQ